MKQDVELNVLNVKKKFCSYNIIHGIIIIRQVFYLRNIENIRSWYPIKISRGKCGNMCCKDKYAASRKM